MGLRWNAVRVCLAMLFGAASPVDSATAPYAVQLTPIKDNTLFEDPQGALSSGIGTGLFAGRNNNSLSRRALLAFNVESIVPPGATVTSVTLTLHLSQSNTTTTVLELFSVTGDWGEGTSDSSAVGGGGAGAFATPEDATWRHRFFDSVFWLNPGGDFAPSPSAAQQVNAIAFYTWGPTPGMIADVQRWIDEPAKNYGWLLRGKESTNQTIKRFDSREIGDPANRPLLRVEYSFSNAARHWTGY